MSVQNRDFKLFINFSSTSSQQLSTAEIHNENAGVMELRAVDISILICAKLHVQNTSSASLKSELNATNKFRTVVAFLLLAVHRSSARVSARLTHRVSGQLRRLSIMPAVESS